MIEYEEEMELNEFEYQFLKGQWAGIGGAAYNHCIDFCDEMGLGTYGMPTEYGQELIDKFEGYNP